MEALFILKNPELDYGISQFTKDLPLEEFEFIKDNLEKGNSIAYGDTKYYLDLEKSGLLIDFDGYEGKGIKKYDIIYTFTLAAK